MFANPAEAVEAIRRAENSPGSETALRLSAEALQQFPNSPELISQRSTMILWTGDLEQAKDIAASASAIAPNHPDVLACLLTLATFEGDFDLAADLYARFDTNLKPTYSQSLADRRISAYGGA